MALRMEQYLQLHGSVLEAFVPPLVARQTITLNTEISVAAQEIGRDRIIDPDEDEYEPLFIPKFGEYTEMSVDVDRVYAKVRKIGEKFTLAEEDILSSQRTGEPLPTLNARKAGVRLAQKEDRFIFTGEPKAKQYGLLNTPGIQTLPADKAWNDTASEPNPYKTIKDAIALIKAEGGRPDFWAVHPLDLSEAQNRDFYGNIYLDQILKLFPNGASAIKESYTIPRGTSMVGTIGKDVAELFITEPANTRPPRENENDSFTFKVRERLAIDVYTPEVLTKITGLYAAI